MSSINVTKNVAIASSDFLANAIRDPKWRRDDTSLKSFLHSFIKALSFLHPMVSSMDLITVINLRLPPLKLGRWTLHLHVRFEESSDILPKIFKRACGFLQELPLKNRC